jgi:leucyl aminopeptidase (aminopeptidase T)
MLKKKKIEAAVIQMLRVNMGVRPGEKILILSDIPARRDWKQKKSAEIEKMHVITYLGKAVAEIASNAFSQCTVDFYPYFSIGRSGAEPTETMARVMQRFDVILAINSFSLTHTQARENASKTGARVATMRGAIAEMFYPDGSISVDYSAVERETKLIAGVLSRANRARIVTPAGTDLSFSLKGRRGREDNGMYVKPGRWGNLPAGEAYIAPIEGSGKGPLVIRKGWHPGLKENMALHFHQGEVFEIEGGGEVGSQLRRILGLGSSLSKKKLRCNLAELGIGTNPKARRVDITIEAEKIKGTLHIGIGDSSHMGGKVVADYHQDFVVDAPDLFLDEEKAMDKGTWLKSQRR